MFINSCAEKTQIQKIDNCITDFIENELESKITKKNDVFITIPLNICSSCLTPFKEVLNNTNSKKFNVHLVISALSKKEINYFAKDYLKKYDIIYDYEMRIENLVCLPPKNIHYFKFVNNKLEKFSLLDLTSNFSQLKDVLAN
jgi:hypothetical protein